MDVINEVKGNSAFCRRFQDGVWKDIIVTTRHWSTDFCRFLSGPEADVFLVISS